MVGEPKLEAVKPPDIGPDQRPDIPRGPERFRVIAELLGNFAFLLAEKERIEQETQSTVDKLRGLGVSWSDIGSVAGTSKQMAHYRFSSSKKGRSR